MEPITGENIRIGFGSDVHRLAENGKPLLLGGVKIENTQNIGPVAHSDGDVLLHALMDAILGAASLGDIGQYFPDTNAKFSGASSASLLAEVLNLVSGMRIVNIDITLQCDFPKIEPHREKILHRVAKLTGIPRNRVNLKAKTFEGLPQFTECPAIFATVALLAMVSDAPPIIE